MRVQNTLPLMYNSEVISYPDLTLLAVGDLGTRLIPRLNKKIAALTKRSLFMFIFLISDFGKISVQPHLYYSYINISFFKLTICVK